MNEHEVLICDTLKLLEAAKCIEPFSIHASRSFWKKEAREYYNVLYAHEKNLHMSADSPFSIPKGCLEYSCWRLLNRGPEVGDLGHPPYTCVIPFTSVALSERK